MGRSRQITRHWMPLNAIGAPMATMAMEFPKKLKFNVASLAEAAAKLELSTLPGGTNAALGAWTITSAKAMNERTGERLLADRAAIEAALATLKAAEGKTAACCGRPLASPSSNLCGAALMGRPCN